MATVVDICTGRRVESLPGVFGCLDHFWGGVGGDSSVQRLRQRGHHALSSLFLFEYLLVEGFFRLSPPTRRLAAQTGVSEMLRRPVFCRFFGPKVVRSSRGCAPCSRTM